MANSRRVGRVLSASAMRSIAGVACVLLGGASTGCSYVSVRTVPERPGELRERGCTSARGAPLIDLGLSALLLGYGTGTMFAPGDEEPVATGAVGATVLFVAAAVAAMSGAYGLSETSACADAKATLDPPAGADHVPTDVDRTPRAMREQRSF
jgi:hypothetical protein